MGFIPVNEQGIMSNIAYDFKIKKLFSSCDVDIAESFIVSNGCNINR